MSTKHTVHPSAGLSFLDRLKARLTRNQQRADSPAAVSQLIASTAKKISDEKDLRVQQTRLLEQQLQYKADAPIRREVERARVLARRKRIRRPQKSLQLRNTYADHEGRLYMDGSNGMLLRVEKPHRNPLLRKLITDKLTKDAAEAGLSLKASVEAARTTAS